MMLTLSLVFEKWHTSLSWHIAAFEPEPEPEPEVNQDVDYDEPAEEEDALASESDLRAEHTLAETSGAKTHAPVGFHQT